MTFAVRLFRVGKIRADHIAPRRILSGMWGIIGSIPRVWSTRHQDSRRKDESEKRDQSTPNRGVAADSIPYHKCSGPESPLPRPERISALHPQPAAHRPGGTLQA